MAAVQQGMKSLRLPRHPAQSVPGTQHRNLHYQLSKTWPRDLTVHRLPDTKVDGPGAMKVNLGTGAQNSHDWDRVLAGDFNSAPETPDWSASRVRSPSAT